MDGTKETLNPIFPLPQFCSSSPPSYLLHQICHGSIACFFSSIKSRASFTHKASHTREAFDAPVEPPTPSKSDSNAITEHTHRRCGLMLR
ncbi:uncharacterized protein G2W53_039845 [Senna tora]|uniref:Uncharacterized protein n=1 Tax=Senna tora TaxID=362788 RepID=A0A834SPA6_9FABA|nr:uncharacterized protein G2W53_039845 [Senna tora]